MRKIGQLQRGEWRYAGLVLVLLLIAGISTKVVVSSLTSPSGLYIDARMLSITLSSLTMGFLFLAGAFGIWAIRSTTAIEGRRRYVRLVEEMDYLADGALLVDQDLRVHAMNIAARVLSGDVRGQPATLREAFPCLTQEDISSLMGLHRPYEVERVSREGHALYSLRFRSQPAEEFCMVLVSDVTAAKTRQMKEAQTGHFQLIGRIARGVSHDFNNILCAVAANASLFERPDADPEGLRVAAETVIREADRGSKLAQQIIHLGDVGATGEPVADIAVHAEATVDLLKVVLPKLWKYQVVARGKLGAIPLAGHQLEQVLLNLGLHAAEEMAAPGELWIQIEPASWTRGGPRDVMIRVAATPAGMPPDPMDGGNLVEIEDGGVIESIVRSLIENVGGELDIFSSHDGHHRYAIRLPGLKASRERATASTGLREEQSQRVGTWHVLLAQPRDGGHRDLERRLQGLGAKVEYASDLVVVLGLLEGNTKFQAAVIDRGLLGSTADALLKAIVKLKPDLGVVVLCEVNTDKASALRHEVAYAMVDAAPDTILEMMIESRDQAKSRGGLAS